METISTILLILLGIYVFIKLVLSIRIIPPQTVFIIERLGKYNSSLQAGFHILIPFIDKVSYKISLKEEAIDVPSQICITKDNVQVKVDGIIYMKVVDPFRAAYHIIDYQYAIIQLCQTTMRSVFGDLDLDKTFEERESLNAKIVSYVEEPANEWGVKIMRYEIQNITPPERVLHSMEKQMSAEREKRALIAKSEGEKQARINRSEGIKQEMINQSEGEKQKIINEAEGKAKEILQVAEATAKGIEQIGEAISIDGGRESAILKVSTDFLDKMNLVAKSETDVILPLDISNLQELIKGLENFITKK